MLYAKILVFNPHLSTFFSLLLEREGERETERERKRERETDREGERHQVERETLVAFLYVPRLGMESTTWLCALMENQTHNFLVYGMMLQPTEPSWPWVKKNSFILFVE